MATTGWAIREDKLSMNDIYSKSNVPVAKGRKLNLGSQLMETVERIAYKSVPAAL